MNKTFAICATFVAFAAVAPVAQADPVIDADLVVALNNHHDCDYYAGLHQGGGGKHVCIIPNGPYLGISGLPDRYCDTYLAVHWPGGHQHVCLVPDSIDLSEIIQSTGTS